jgi:arginyl-tRNA synthetase
MITKKIEKLIEQALADISLEVDEIFLEHPADLVHGDYSTNLAMVLAKKNKRPPLELAIEIAGHIEAKNDKAIEKVEVAAPGFINFHLTKEFFVEETERVLKEGEKYGQNDQLHAKKVIVEYTDPNPFKEFHIGHLMNNTLGESFARLLEFSGANLRRACYQGDVGMHVAMAVWGIIKSKTSIRSLKNIEEPVKFLGACYALGAKHHKKNDATKKEIGAINRKIYQRSDPEISEIYDWGREVSLDHFEKIYQKLSTRFDHYFFESKTGEFGRKIVQEHLALGVFEESEGAVVFRGEKFDNALHTRVFINSEGLPTYEAKELGLSKIKHEVFPYDGSVVVTGNEVNDYFKVVLKAMELVFPELAEKTKHVSHGMLRLPSGKMSSRTGSVISAEGFIAEVEERVAEKMKDREFTDEEKQRIVSQVAVGAIKYAILRQAPGKDVIFEHERSLSFEGDSGPYLQYSAVRARSVMAKALAEGVAGSLENANIEKNELERMLYRFPETVFRSANEFAPHHIVTYLTELAGVFNSFYANQIIVDNQNEHSPYFIALTSAFQRVMENGLQVLGIEVPDKM